MPSYSCYVRRCSPRGKADTAGLRAVSRALYLFATLFTELEGHPRPFFILDAEFYATGAAFEGRDEDTPEEELSFSEPIAETDGVWETHFALAISIRSACRAPAAAAAAAVKESNV